jgi:hypothetical protein
LIALREAAGERRIGDLTGGIHPGHRRDADTLVLVGLPLLLPEQVTGDGLELGSASQLRHGRLLTRATLAVQCAAGGTTHFPSGGARGGAQRDLRILFDFSLLGNHLDRPTRHSP